MPPEWLLEAVAAFTLEQAGKDVNQQAVARMSPLVAAAFLKKGASVRDPSAGGSKVTAV